MKGKMYLLLLIFPFFSCSVELFPFTYMDKVGYLDKNLKQVIPAIYRKGSELSDSGYIVVSRNYNEGIILNKYGRKVYTIPSIGVENVFGDAFLFDSGRNGMGIRNIKTGEIIAEHISVVLGASENKIAVEFSGGDKIAGYISFDGKPLFNELMLKRAYSYNEGIAVVQLADLSYAIIDENGIIQNKKKYSLIEFKYSDGLCLARDMEGNIGYIDKKGEFVIEKKIPYVDGMILATRFSGGVALIAISENPLVWKFINKKGEFISDEYFFDAAQDFINGYSIITIIRNNKPVKGILRIDGKYLIQPLFDEAGSFNKMYAIIKYNGRDGIINKDGVVFWADDFVNGRIKGERL